ncbi:unnamed protein product [Ilex paraguariensis]|uniref:tRNA:m(4)X modification enzyme TRM13 n=1 Tax=Ilex paraguariensis TaxID=185542 RepID=A0ABC8RLG2_9AQUA
MTFEIRTRFRKLVGFGLTVKWTASVVGRKLPFQEKHVLQQASILGNIEEFGVMKSCGMGWMRANSECNGSSGDDNDVPAVVEFGAGRGYLTQMLADCYKIKKVLLVERKSYKLKADRSLRQKESFILERLRIDIEDLNLNAVESLQGVPYLAVGKHLCGPATVEDLNLNAVESLQGVPYLAVGKHLCGPATDMTLRCCIQEQCNQVNAAHCKANCSIKGLAIATCCHHLCQWKHYINKRYLSNLGITMEDFHAITWFTSWAVDADHGSDLSDVDCRSHIQITEMEECSWDSGSCGVEEIIMNMRAVERAVLGFMCKDIIDVGRLMWVRKQGLETQLVKYVQSNISPENHLLIARHKNIF